MSPAPRRALLAPALAALAVLAVALVLPTLLGWGARTSPAHPSATARPSLQLGPAAQAQMSRSIGRGDRRYWAHAAGGGALTMHGPSGLSAAFDARGATVRSGHDTVRIALAGIAGGAATHAVAASVPRGHRNIVGYSHAGVSEWYAGGPLGIEQGFDIAAAPGSGQTVTLALAIGGNLAPSLEAGGGGLVLSRAGRPSLLYGGLSATDARGRRLHTWLSLHGRTALLHVDAAGAAYPLHVDPFLQEGEKVVSPGGEKAQFGQSRALSNDGTTAVVGEYLANKAIGCAYIFTRLGATWTQQAKLQPTKESVEEGEEAGGKEIQFGEQVAISGDGNTVVIGGYEWGFQKGAFWVFTRNEGLWTEQQRFQSETFGMLGSGISLSEDGNTALIGAQDTEGGAYIYKRSAGKWSQTANLMPKGPYPGFFGEITSMSADGKTVAIGAPFDNGEVGSVFVFAESGGTWKQQAKLVGSEVEGKAYFGTPALSSDGNTLAVGAQDDQPGGAMWFFTRTEGKWSQQGPKIKPPEVSFSSSFGATVSLSGDGNTALIGGANPPGDGAYWLFKRSEGQWVQQGPPSHLTGVSGEGEVEFGVYPTLSRDGLTAIAGVPADHGNDGAFFTLTVPPTVETGPAAAPSTNGFTLTGFVNVHGHHSAECAFEYGSTPSYGTTVPCSPGTVSGESPVEVSHALSGLPEGTYHYRVRVTNLLGTFYGPDQSASTLASVATGSASEPTEPAVATDGNLSAEATGGTGSITVGAYGPAAGGPLLPSAEGGGYVDVYRSQSSSFKQVVAKDCELGGASTAWWYDPTVGWRPMPASTAAFESGCVTITITPTSSPSLSQLTGTRIKFGAPPGSTGQCVKGKNDLFSDAGCLEKHGKNGIPDHKGKYEWYVPPVCYEMKKGHWSGSACEKEAVSSKGKGEGTHEKGDTSFTGSAKGASFEIASVGTVSCSATSAAGEWTGSFRGTEAITFTGCELSEKDCSTGSDKGVIRSGNLELLSAGEKEAEGGIEYDLVLDGSTEPFATFTCDGTKYTVSGAIEGKLLGTVKAMSSTFEAEFGPAIAQQEVFTQYGEEIQSTKISLKTSDKSTQPIELDPAVPVLNG